MNRRIMFDENCEFCVVTKNVVEKYGSGSDLSFVTLDEMRERGIRHDDHMLERITVLDDSGKAESEGIDSMIFISRRVGVLYPLYPFFRLLKTLGIGQAFYDLIARNRYLISSLMKRTRAL